MKNLLLTIFLSYNLTSIGQICSRSGSFYNGDGTSVSGTAELKNDNGTLTLYFTNFISDSGPDLDVYLSSSERTNNNSIKLEALKSLSGNQNYAIPNNISLDDYSFVVIHCTEYNHWYGSAQFGTTTGSCSSVGVQSPQLENVQTFLVNNQIRIVSEKVIPAQVQIFDLSGKSVYNQQVEILNTEIQLANLPKGILLLHITSKEGNLNKKLIVR